MAKMLENSVLDFVDSFFYSIFVVQKERENALTFCNGNERKKPRARFTTNNGAKKLFNITKVWKLIKPTKRRIPPRTPSLPAGQGALLSYATKSPESTMI